MKKLLIVLLSVIFLTACSTNSEDETQQNDNQDEKVPTQEENTSAEADDETSMEEDESEAPENSTQINNDHLRDFVEFDYLAEELDLTTHEGVVETDNEGNRIIIFQTEEGIKEYKSIFVKHDHRLKIVQFDNEDNLLFNDIIE